jgi:hypothetical protein
VNSENSLSRRHFFADVNKFYDIGKELFIIDGEARLLIILIGKKYILTIVPKTHCWTFTVDINILVIFARTGETGNKGKGRENRCRTRDFRDRVYTCYEFILCELYYKE